MLLPLKFSIKPLIVALGIALGFVLTCVANAEPAQDSTHEIKDLYYGDALFNFFQDHYFTTLTGVMVSQHFGRVSHHEEDAEILRGGILLSYGLHREAGDVFERLIDTGASPATRDRAWFYLAKIRYQRGYFPEAEAALKHIGDALPQELQEECGMLQANLLMARSDFVAAIDVLTPLEKASVDATYARYNLGIALIKTGSTERGIAMLNQVGVAPAGDEEHRSLRDRANLALGFSALSDNKNADARQYFERIRLKSAQANKALLGMGWSLVADKNFKEALVPWLELSQRDDNDTAELEAKLAVPYAYAELGALGQSAKLYQESISAFSREDSDLNESINAIQSGKLVDALIAENPSEDMGWLGSIKSLPVMPHSAHLTRVLAQHEFQEAFKNYRDLRFLAKNLDDWRDKLNVFQDMLENRRKAFSERLPQVMQQAQEVGIPSMRNRKAELTQLVASGDTDVDDGGDGSTFADAKQLALLARIKEMQSLIAQHPNEAEFSAAGDKVRLVQGTLIWQLAQDYRDRYWQAKKDLQEITKQLAHAEQLEAELLQAQQDEPARFDQLAKRITAISSALNGLMPRIAALSKEQQRAVQEIAVIELSHDKEMLTQYATQARFALAQLYDRSTGTTDTKDTKATEADHATP
jgi:hypothetical protein